MTNWKRAANSLKMNSDNEEINKWQMGVLIHKYVKLFSQNYVLL